MEPARMVHVYFASGVRYELPADTDVETLTNDLRSAMENKAVHQHTAQWGDGSSATLLFNGEALGVVAVEEGSIGRRGPGGVSTEEGSIGR